MKAKVGVAQAHRFGKGRVRQFREASQGGTERHSRCREHPCICSNEQQGAPRLIPGIWDGQQCQFS